MDSPFFSSLLLALGILLSFLALLVQSQGNNRNNYHVSQTYHSSPPPPPPPPPRVSPPPPPPPPPAPVSPPPPTHRNNSAPPRHPKRSSHHSNYTQPATGHRRHKNGDKHKQEKQNVGKEVGFWFLVVATALQVCAAGFLIYKRRQLFKDQDILS